MLRWGPAWAFTSSWRAWDFTRRALAAGVVAGALAAAAMAVLHVTATPVFTELTRGRGLPLVVVSVLSGLAVLVVPSFAVLFRLTLGGRLGGTGMAVAAEGVRRWRGDRGSR